MIAGKTGTSELAQTMNGYRATHACFLVSRITNNHWIIGKISMDASPAQSG